MDIKELNKRQLILVTLLITFVVSIATGIVTVSLMQQMPKSVPQTINNVIQRTIEKVTTVEVPIPVEVDKKNITEEKESTALFVGDGNMVISIYSIVQPEKIIVSSDEPIGSINKPTIPIDEIKKNDVEKPEALGQGVLISDMGLILVETSILKGGTEFRVVLNNTDFDAVIMKKFSNNFTVLKILSVKEKQDIEEAKMKTEETKDVVPPIDN